MLSWFLRKHFNMERDKYLICRRCGKKMEDHDELYCYIGKFPPVKFVYRIPDLFKQTVIYLKKEEPPKKQPQYNKDNRKTKKNRHKN